VKSELQAWHLIENVAGDLVGDFATRTGDGLLKQVTCLEMGGSSFDKQTSVQDF
jgi:hypothetical protein